MQACMDTYTYVHTLHSRANFTYDHCCYDHLSCSHCFNLR
jgi:hypothetical protein